MSSAKKIFINRDVPPEIMKILTDAGLEIEASGKIILSLDELLKFVKGKDGIYGIGLNITKEVIEAAGPQLKVVSVFSVGVDSVDLDALKKHGIRLGHTPDVLTDAVAETAVMLMLMCSRIAMKGVHKVKSGGWKHWEPFTSLGVDVRNSTVGIVGLGRIGTKVGKLLQPFGVGKIIYHSRRENKQAAKDINAEYVSFDNLLSQSDFVVCCCSLNEDSKELFSYKEFDKMKSNAIFVNIGRGAMVNQDALVDALQNQKIFAAGLDVTMPEPLPTDHPLLRCDNCVVLPHTGSATIQTRLDMGILAANNLVAGLNGTPMPAEYPL